MKTIRKAVERFNKKFPNAIYDFWSEGNKEEWGGDYWVSIRGFAPSDNPECHGIHEPTVKDVLDCIRILKPCDCPECAPLWDNGTWKGGIKNYAKKGEI